MSWSGTLLLLGLVVLGVVTLFPFEFRSTPVLERVAEGVRPSTLPTVAEVVANVLLFVPAGVLLHRRGGRRHVGWSRLLLACGAGLLISLAVELAQVWLPRRDPAILDVAANGAGTMIGAVVDRLWTGADGVLARWRTAAPAGLLPALLGAYTAFALAAAGTLQRESSLGNWSDMFPLQFGNERTGDRAWRGRLFAFELADAAMTQRALRRFAAGEPAPLRGNTIARYDFSGAAPFRDHAGRVPDLEWSGHRVQTGDLAGVRLPGTPWLQTEEPVPAIPQRVTLTNAFSLRVECASDDVTQRGPARIVSHSIDVNLRNVTIAQYDTDLVIRIRTPHTGRNGSRPEVVVPAVFSPLTRRDILVSYDGAAVQTAIAGSRRVHRVPFRPGPILARGVTSLSIESDEYQTVERMYVGLLFVPPAVLIAFLRDARRDRRVIGAAWTVAFAMLYEGTLTTISGSAFSWPDVVVAAAIGLAVVSVVATAGSKPASLPL